MPRLGAVSMHNVWLIAHREYTERIRTRGFLITTIMIPLIMAGLVFGSMFLGSTTPGEVHLAVVSSDTQLVLDLQTELLRQQEQREASQAGTEDHQPTPNPAKRPPHILVDAMNAGPGTRAELNRELDRSDLDGYLWITAAAAAGDRPTFAYTPRASGDSSDGTIQNVLAGALATVLMREQLTHRGVVAGEADTLLQPVVVVASRGPHRQDSQDRESAQISVSVLFFVMYMVIMLYGMNVARSIIEEKTSRIFEVLLATIRPEAMMAGKILGVGSVGLTQVGIWLTAALLLVGASAVLDPGGGFPITLSAIQVVFFFLYFILGYLFYASIAAALGAMTNSEQELQQLNMFLVLPLLFCFVLLRTLLSNPDSTLARVLALVPPFTPLLMYCRVSLGHPAAWEIALSLVLTSASICGMVWVTSRIYRVGVLMYGKRPSLPEIFRWLKYS